MILCNKKYFKNPKIYLIYKVDSKVVLGIKILEILKKNKKLQSPIFHYIKNKN